VQRIDRDVFAQRGPQQKGPRRLATH
jgi:hypothetical protein